MSKTLRTIALAMLALALFAGSAFAAAVEPGTTPVPSNVMHRWVGLAGDNDWHTAANWDPATIPAQGDGVLFPASVNVIVTDDTASLDTIVVVPNALVEINVRQGKKLKVGGEGNSSIYVAAKGRLKLTGSGMLELQQSKLVDSEQDVSFVTESGDNGVRTQLIVDVEVRQPGDATDAVTKNTFFRISDNSELTFTKPINATDGDAWKIPAGDAAMIFGAKTAATYPKIADAPAGLITHTTLCVNHASQIQAQAGNKSGQKPFVIAPMQGTLKVARSISVMGGHESFQTLLSTHQGDIDYFPKFDVVEGATFTITAGATAAAAPAWFDGDKKTNFKNNADFALVVDPNEAKKNASAKFAKLGKGTLRLVGGATDWGAAISSATFTTLAHAAALDDEVKHIDVMAGTLAMARGGSGKGRPAWEPSADGTNWTDVAMLTAANDKWITVWPDATFFAENTEAVRPNNGFNTGTPAANGGKAVAAKDFLLYDMRFENSGTVRIGEYAAIANLLESLPFAAGTTGITGERYPDEEATTASVYLLPRGSVHMAADTAVLDVDGDQAFKRVWGGEYPDVSKNNTGYGGTIDVAEGADLILTEMDEFEFPHDSNVDGHRFFGNVLGEGGVAFSKAYPLVPGGKMEDTGDITTQYFPFLGLLRNERGYIVGTRNDYGDATIVYGRTRLVVDQDSILPKPSGNSFGRVKDADGKWVECAKGAMYLRSDRPYSLLGDVGSLRARKTTVKGHYPDTVYIDHLMVDGAVTESNRAWVDVSAADYRGVAPYKQGDPYVPLSWEDQLMRDYGLRLLAVKDVSYSVNKPLVSGTYKDAYSFLKTGDSTLLLLEKGRGALKEDMPATDGVVIQRGRVWLRGEGTLTEEDLAEGIHWALSACSVKVDPSNRDDIVPSAPLWTDKTKDTEDVVLPLSQWTCLHVSNGLDIQNDLYYEDKGTYPRYGLFVTELREENRDFSGLDPEGNPLQGRRPAVNVATKVRGEGIDFQGSILQAHIAPEKGAFLIFESDETIQKGILKGFLGLTNADTGFLTVYTTDRWGKGANGYALGETHAGLLGVAMLQDITETKLLQTQKASFTIPMEANADVELSMVKVEALTGLLADLVPTLSGTAPNYTITVTANINAAQGTSLTYYPKELVQVSVYVEEDGPGDPEDVLNGQRVYPIDLGMFDPENPDKPGGGDEPTPPTPTIPESQSAVSAPSSSTVAHDATDPVTFTISDASYNAATGELTILDENGVAKTLTAPKVYVNGTAIDPVAGVDFFKDNGDGTVTVTVPASALSTGTNTITVGDDTLRTKGVTVTKEAAPGPGPEPTPSSSGGGGCDAGFGGLALAGAALVVLRKRG